MKKILSLILVISLVIPLTLSFADVNTSDEFVLSDRVLKSALKEYQLSKENIIYKSTPKEKSDEIMVNFEDGSTLVISSNNYSYSKIVGDEMIIQTNNSGSKNMISYDYLNLNDDVGKKSVVDGDVGTKSSIYEEELNGFGYYFKYLFRQTLSSRVYTLTVSSGRFKGTTESYTRYTPNKSLKQRWEGKADNFLYHLSSNNDLANEDFVTDLFDEANQYFPSFSISEKEDAVDIFIEIQEDGYKEASSTIASAATTALIDKFGHSFASRVGNYVEAGMSVASFPVIEINYYNLYSDYDSFRRIY